MKKVLYQAGNNKLIVAKATAKKAGLCNLLKPKVKPYPHCPTAGDNDHPSAEKKSSLELGARVHTEESQNTKKNALKSVFKANNNRNQLAISSKNFKKKVLNINTSGNNSGELSSLSKNRSGSEKDKDSNSKDHQLNKRNDFKSNPFEKRVNKEKASAKGFEAPEMKESGHIKKVSINLNENHNNHYGINGIKVKARVKNGYNYNVNSEVNAHQKPKNDAPAPSQVFSSISTFNTLVQINSKERRIIPSLSQLNELNELNKRLQMIKDNKVYEHLLNSNGNSQPYPQFNVINAEMLAKDVAPLQSAPNKDSIASMNKEITVSSNQRLQTYQLLLSCINSKFNEIQEIVDNDFKQYNRDTKVSELHSKIDFTQEHINLLQNSCDYIDEMQEKSNMIVPKGANPNVTENFTMNFNQNIATRKCIETSNFDFTSEFNNSELLGKTKGEYDDKNLLSFLSNEMMSFFQPSLFVEGNKLAKGGTSKHREATPPQTPTENPPKTPHYAETQDSIIDANDDYEVEEEDKAKEELQPHPQQINLPQAASSDKCVVF